MKKCKVIGKISTKAGNIYHEKFTKVTIRAEKINTVTVVSLADDDIGIMLEVDYSELKKLVED